MAAKLAFKYDPEGDILYINKMQPYLEQEPEELGDEVIAKLNPKTGEIVRAARHRGPAVSAEEQT